MDFSNTIIVGRVTANPELRITPSGQPVTRMGVATNRTWTDKQGQKQEETEFHNVVLWGRQAEIAAEFLVKGSGVLVSGRLKTRDWTDKDGQKHRSTEIIAEQLQLGQRPQGKVEKPSIHVRPEDMPAQEEQADSEIRVDDIPF